MDKFVAILWICCAISIAKCQDDTVDCSLPPPTNVDPSICCRISKPFDRLNFPDCFADVDDTSTARNEIIPRTDWNLRQDLDDLIRTRFNVGQRQTPTSTFSYDDQQTDDRRIGNRRIGNRRIYNRKTSNWRTGSRPYSNGNRDTNRDDRYYTNNRDSDRGSGEDDRQEQDHQHHGKPHWGYKDRYHHGGGWHHGHHGDYHSYGAGGRYRHRRQLDRQLVVRTSVDAQVTLGSGIGNGNCAMQCIFNQTSVVRDTVFNRDAALILYAKYFPEVPLDLLFATVNKCYNQVKILPSNRTNRSRNTPNRCWNGPGVFAACFNKEIYTQCPDNIRTSGEDCDALRNYIDQCSPSN